MRKFLTLPKLIVFVLIVAVAITGTWLGLRTLIANGMTTSIQNLEEQGFEVGHGGLTVSGFPFVVDARTKEVSIRAPASIEIDPTKNWSIKMDEVDVYSSTFTPLSWSLQHRGDLRVDMRGIEGERYMFDVAPANIYGDAAVGLSGKLKRMHADMGRARINSLVGSEPPVLGLSGVRADIVVKGDEAHFDILGKDFILAEKYLGVANTILGKELSRVSIIATVENWPLLEAGENDGWLASPARVKSDDWSVRWGTADIVGDFDIGFVDGLPDGVIRFRVKNAPELLQKITGAGLIPPAMGLQLSTYISGLDSDEDDRKLIEITMRNGVVKYGFFTLHTF